MTDNVRSSGKRTGQASNRKWLHSQGDDLRAQALEVAGIKVLAAMLIALDAKGLREIADKFKDKLKLLYLLLAPREGDKVSLVAAVSNRYHRQS